MGGVYWGNDLPTGTDKGVTNRLGAFFNGPLSGGGQFSLKILSDLFTGEPYQSRTVACRTSCPNKAKEMKSFRDLRSAPLIFSIDANFPSAQKDALMSFSLSGGIDSDSWGHFTQNIMAHNTFKIPWVDNWGNDSQTFWSGGFGLKAGYILGGLNPKAPLHLDAKSPAEN